MKRRTKIATITFEATLKNGASGDSEIRRSIHSGRGINKTIQGRANKKQEGLNHDKV
ncbi:MAG: hypothetical protein ACUVUQ_04675 [Thermodesulfovibrionales bacterium]